VRRPTRPPHVPIWPAAFFVAWCRMPVRNYGCLVRVGETQESTTPACCRNSVEAPFLAWGRMGDPEEDGSHDGATPQDELYDGRTPCETKSAAAPPQFSPSSSLSQLYYRATLLLRASRDHTHHHNCPMLGPRGRDRRRIILSPRTQDLPSPPCLSPHNHSSCHLPNIFLLT